MSFLSQFQRFIEPSDFDSEMVRILSAIGVNADLAILESINMELQTSMEFSAFNDTRIRSWLAFFFRPVRNYISANGTVAIRIDSAAVSVSIPKGSMLSNSNGQQYEQLSDLFLNEGESASFAVRQGEMASDSGNYDEFIAISAPYADMSDMQVFLNGAAVTPCDIAFNLVRPYNGYVSFYYNATLFVKIYKGDTVPDPAGQSYEVRYRTSVGTIGNTTTDSFTSYATTITDINGGDVTYTLTNAPITNGSNPPLHYELVNMLRSCFLSQSGVASITEYRAWYLSQPEIGDCRVMGDYEKWVSTGELNVTGRITVYLMDKAGQPIIGGAASVIDARLANVRDLAIIDYEFFNYIQQFFEIQFRSTLDDAAFVAYAQSTIQNFFSLEWVKNHNLSLFDALDVSLLELYLTSQHSPVGLRIIPYHYKKIFFAVETFQITTQHYNSETPDGHYELKDVNDNVIARFKERHFVDDNVVRIVDESSGSDVVVGNRDGGLVYISYTFPADSNLECYWTLEYTGSVSVGGSNSARSLGGSNFTKYKVI